MTLTLTFRTGPKSSLPEIALALSCTTSAHCHEDIVSNLSPMFALIPELHTSESSPPLNNQPSAEPPMVKLGPACSNFPHTVASKSSANTPHPIASTLVADANTSGPPVTSVLT